MKKAWLAGLLALAWIAFSSHWFLCKICGCCGDAAVPTISMPSTDPYQFTAFGKADFTENALFPAWKMKTLAAGGIGDTLVIYGHYGPKEAGGERLGIARAEQLKSRLAGSWDAARIFCRAKMIPELSEASFPAMAASFDWLKARIDKTQSTIISQGNEVIILFPFRSAVKEVDKKVDAFLKNLVAQQKSTTAKISITGHTDNVGDEMPNQKLGQARADFIASILRRGGIAANRISTASKGETQPIATNDDDAGRQQNRRVVLTVNP